MGLTIDFPAALARGIRKTLSRKRIIGWIGFSAVMLLGLIYSFVSHDPMQFARVGSLGVVVGLLVAHWRLVALRKQERYVEWALTNPEAWLIEGIRRTLPGIEVTPAENPQTVPLDKVKSSVVSLIDEADKITFRDEFSIVVISTIVWGYGDLILLWLFPSMFPAIPAA